MGGNVREITDRGGFVHCRVVGIPLLFSIFMATHPSKSEYFLPDWLIWIGLNVSNYDLC